MILVDKNPNADGAHGWYSADNWTPVPGVDQLPVPASMEHMFQAYAPFVTLTVEGGQITALADNPAAREAAKAQRDKQQAAPTLEDRLSAAEEALLALMGVTADV